MAGFKFQFYGLSDLARNMTQSMHRLPQTVGDVMEKAVEMVASDSRLNAPYRTGNLKRSIQTRVEKNGLLGRIYADYRVAPYAIWQEIGTKYFKGKHYMEKGFDQNKTQIDMMFDRLGLKIVKEMGK